MESVSSTSTTAQTQQNQPVSSPATDSTTETKASDSEFASYMEKLLGNDKKKEVSEEELFSALVQRGVQKLKGAKGEEEFVTAMSAAKATSRVGNGCGYEDAAKSALQSLLSSKTLTEEEGNTIYSQSFQNAQLDDNKDVLFDSKGGNGDPTRAVELLEKALSMAQSSMSEIEADATKLNSRSLSESTPGIAAFSKGASSTGSPTSSSPIDGNNGFLFKPMSDNTGKLVILSPESLSGQIEKVLLKDENDKELESGTYSGNGNGGRDHFRFSKAGGSYPKNLTVEFVLKGGETKDFEISDPSQRYD